MAADTRESFLTRWSRRKLAALREDDPATSPAPPAPSTPPAPGAPGASSIPASAAVANSAPPAEPALPPLDTLTFDSDFTAFLRPGVDPAVQRVALRTLLRDARFNVMDGLDVYIDDYTKPSPLDPAIARTLVQAQAVLYPRRTRVTAEGIVEDVPDEPHVADARGEPAPEDPPAAPPRAAPMAEDAAQEMAESPDADRAAEVGVEAALPDPVAVTRGQP